MDAAQSRPGEGAELTGDLVGLHSSDPATVILSGIAVGFGGVWLASVPNLIFIPITPGGDRPAGKPQVLLDGWNINDTKHNVVNGLEWGPDGWLYGLNGIQSRSRVGTPGTWPWALAARLGPR